MFKGVVSLVTGGASGLGRATAEHIIKTGGRAVLADLPTSAGQEVADQMGDRAVFVPMNVKSSEDVARTMAVCKEKFGRLDLTVNCAAIACAFTIFNRNNKRIASQADLAALLMVNALGTFNVASQSAALMSENTPDADGGRGVIVNTSAGAAYDGQTGQVMFAGSKGAVSGMTLPLARDLADLGIRVNAIAPGMFMTPLQDFLPTPVKEFISRNVPFPPRFGHPHEFALMVEAIFTNTYLNGENIRLDGAVRLLS